MGNHDEHDHIIELPNRGKFGVNLRVLRDGTPVIGWIDLTTGNAFSLKLTDFLNIMFMDPTKTVIDILSSAMEKVDQVIANKEGKN